MSEGRRKPGLKPNRSSTGRSLLIKGQRCPECAVLIQSVTCMTSTTDSAAYVSPCLHSVTVMLHQWGQEILPYGYGTDLDK